MATEYDFRGVYFGNGNPSFKGVSVSGEYQPDISGATFFVDSGTGNDYNVGKSWSKPFKTLEKAIEVSNIDITNVKNLARRNTIFLTGSSTISYLTVFPINCDVVGVGTSSGLSKAVVIGSHVPNVEGTTGTRFFNIWWQNLTEQKSIFLLNSTVVGCEFHGCSFSSAYESIINQSSMYMVVSNCRFGGATGAGINLDSGALGSVTIEDSIFAPTGIEVYLNVTVTEGGYIRRNCIQSTSVAIRDDSWKFHIIDNRVFTLGLKGTNGNWQ